jgi:peroxiredoxin
MVLMESIKIPLGTKMPGFQLNDPFGRSFDSEHLYGEKGLLVFITCNHCPYAKAVWPRQIRLAKLARGLGINAVGINPNIHPDYPEDAPEWMIKKIDEIGIDFPYLVDETQETAKAFKAQCTPDIYLFDKEHRLVYHGRIDDNWKDATKVTKEELKEAIENLAKDIPISRIQYPSMGCSIKWR